MQARQISIGAELFADRLDTNGPRLAEALFDRGFELAERVTVGDEPLPDASVQVQPVRDEGPTFRADRFAPDARTDATGQALVQATPKDWILVWAHQSGPVITFFAPPFASKKENPGRAPFTNGLDRPENRLRCRWASEVDALGFVSKGRNRFSQSLP